MTDGYDGARELANQIIVSAAKEHMQSAKYTHVLEWGLIHLDPKKVKKDYFIRIQKALEWYQDSIKDCTDFFHSDWYATLTTLSADFMMRNLKKTENEWFDEFDLKRTSEQESMVKKAVEFCEESIALDIELEKEETEYALHRRDAEEAVPNTKKDR